MDDGPVDDDLLRGGEAGAVGSDVVDGVGQDLTDDLRSHPVRLRRKRTI